MPHINTECLLSINVCQTSLSSSLKVVPEDELSCHTLSYFVSLVQVSRSGKTIFQLLPYNWKNYDSGIEVPFSTFNKHETY